MAEKEAAVVVRQMTAIGGTLEERTKAFQQIASCASSGLFPAGYDSVPKILAASWFADGLGIHPTIYMEGIQPVQFGGKTIREPKWEFVNALLRSRLPGFDYQVIEESETACEIEFFATGRKAQKVRYSMDDAVRQGLAGPTGRNKAGYAANPREMLWKQAFKRGAERIGGDALAGMPTTVWEVDESPAPEPEKTTTQAIHEAMQRSAAKTEAEEIAFQEVPAGDTERLAVENADSRQRLAVLMIRLHGKLSKAVLAEKVAGYYNAMMEERTGVNPNIVFKKGEVGPVEAEQLCDYLEDLLEKKDAPEDEAPPAEDEAPPAEAPQEEQSENPLVAAYDSLMVTIDRARKVFAPRKFIQESPPGGGVYWFVDKETFSQLGLKDPVKIQKAGNIVAPFDKIEALDKVLKAAVDEKERGR